MPITRNKDPEDMTMTTAGLRSVLGHAEILRKSVKGLDMMPVANLWNVWPLINLLHNLLEISLKHLLRLNKLASEEEFIGFGHSLSKTYERLHEKAKNELQENYAQIVSLLDCGVGETSGFDTKKYPKFLEYLKAIESEEGFGQGKKQKGIIAWRYSLLEGFRGSRVMQSNPMHVDVLYAMTQHVIAMCYDRKHRLSFLDRLHQEAYALYSSHGGLDCFPAEPENDTEMVIEDYISWRDTMGGGAFLNGILAHVSVGPMLTYHKDSVGEWIEKVTSVFTEAMVDPSKTNPLLKFAIDTACQRRLCIDLRKKRFVHGGSRPTNIQEEIIRWHTGWSMCWKVNGVEKWKGILPIDVSGESSTFHIPDRKNQKIQVDWYYSYEENRPNLSSIEELDIGLLSFFYKGLLVAKVSAVAVIVHPLVMGGIVSSIEDAFTKDDQATEVEQVEFMMIDLNDGWVLNKDKELINSKGQSVYSVWSESSESFDCPVCLGTGFCSKCFGDLDKCYGGTNCKKATFGLCAKCLGYGGIGDMKIALAVNP